MSKNEVQAPYTILLVGELAGVSKTSAAFELISDVLVGNAIDYYDFDMLNHSN